MINTELIKFINKNIEYGDFNGPDSVLSIEEQTEYLSILKENLVSNNKSFLDKKIVSEQEIEDALNKIKKEDNPFRKRQYLKQGNVRLIPYGEFEHINLYTNKATIENKTVSLFDDDTMPQASFDYHGENISILDVTIKIDDEYFTPLRGNIESTLMGKYLEFRNEIKELFRIQFMSDGQACLGLLEKDIFHHSFKPICVVNFKEEIHLNIKKEEKGYCLSINQSVEHVLLDKYINYFVASGGMFPTKGWKITINHIVDDKNKEINLFTPIKNKDEIVNLGKKDIPCCIGGYQNRNKAIEFVAPFYLDSLQDVYLHVSSIDPCGQIYINDHLLLNVDSFSSKEINIANFVNKGENNLKIIVFPRSPENIVSWHRNFDPYFGSFIGEIYIENRKKTHISNAVLKTLSVSPTNVELFTSIDGPIQKDLKLLLIIKDEKENVVATQLVNKKHCLFKNTILVQPWNVKNPKLYTIILRLCNEKEIVDEYVFNYGFRTIVQKRGDFLFNNEKFIMKGALLMQYLPNIDEVCINHVCPSDAQIVSQLLTAKKMNANTVRMHVLGYGNNEARYARIADAIGINVIWTTRYIDSVSTCLWNKTWKQKEEYLTQIKDVLNYCSIIAYEGANEMSVNKEDISNIYSEFVTAIKKIDKTRLLFPISHPYYANDSYNRGKGCGYYQDDGCHDEFFNDCPPASKEWNDSLVVRSAHTYNWLLGYGMTWDKLRKQDWSGQENLLNSKHHAYVVSEYATIGRMNPKKINDGDFINLDSYEYGDEYALNYHFENDYLLSQAYQALASRYSSKQMLLKGVDGLLWCSLISGANHGSYAKPIVDFNYYPKLGFFTLKEAFSDLYIGDNSTDILWGKNHIFNPTILGFPDYKKHQIKIKILDLEGKVILYKKYDVTFKTRNQIIDKIKNPFSSEGYYRIVYEIE